MITVINIIVDIILSFLYNLVPQAPRSVTSFCTVIVWKAPSRAYGFITGYDIFFSNSNTQVIVRKNRDEFFHAVQERELPTNGPEEEIVVQVQHSNVNSPTVSRNLLHFRLLNISHC